MTSSFLAAILPRDGLRCIAVFNYGMKHAPDHYFFDTNEEAAAFALAQDAEGLPVYHACASYKERRKKEPRKVNNVHSVQSLWLDIDLGAEEAIPALAAFVRDQNLPCPLVVSSGRGLHVYWPLAVPLTANDWKRYALGLKALGLGDTVRTADAASILRPVGTHNRKHGNETKVIWGGPKGPYPIESFRELLVEPKAGSISALPPRPSWVPSAPSGTYEALRTPQAPSDPADANAIADRCAQMGAMRDTRGKLPYPLWRAGLSVLSCCSDGQSLAHEWSKGDERYDPVQTQAKLDEFAGPHKCETFRGLNPEGCKGCKFALEVSTPLQLGRPPYTVPPPLDHSPTLPKGFRLDETGLWHASEDNKGELVKKVVSLTPFFLKRIVQVFNDQEGTHYVFEIRPPREEVKEITLPAPRVSGSISGGVMAGVGVRISDAATFQKYLNEGAALLQAQGRSDVIYKQFGWKDEDTTFLVGDRMYTPTGVKSAAGAGGTHDRAVHFPLLGDLQTWTDNADMLCASGCEAQQFAILASAAAPLMRFHQKDEGGAIYSMSSRLSATGKSTAFDAAQSFWGERDGMSITNIGTIKSRNAIMATGCNLPVFFDEASQRDPKMLMEFCQTFTNGRAGDGCQVDGTLRKNPLTWQTVLLCGSNVPMLEILGALGGSEAMMNRILEVCPSLPPGLSSNGEHMRRVMKANSGQAGHLYLQYLTEKPEVITWAKKTLETAFNDIGAGFPLEARFLVRLITAAEKAGEILRKLDILHCDPKRMTEWAIEQAKDQLTGIASFARVNAIASYLNTYPNDILTVQGEGRHAGFLHHRPGREMRGRFETNTGMLYIAVPPFRKWLAQHDFSFREVCAEMKRDGAMVDMRLITLSAGTILPPSGQAQCIIMKSEVVGFAFSQEAGSNVVKLERGS